MRFTYCPDCGTKLIKKEIGDEGELPYCNNCQKPLFDMFSTCVIVLVKNKDKVLLLNQSYISTQYRNLVSGYMKPGESAEECAMREVEEEVGIKLDSLEIVGTYWFSKKGLLMIGFMGETSQSQIRLSPEVDNAEWVDYDKAPALVHPKGGGSVSAILVEENSIRITKNKTK
jgi:NAD+ diphosphatase